MIPPIIRKQALWFFGVLVALALKEGLTSILPHFFDPADGIRSNHLEELWRLFIFVVLAVRFYFGASYYFEQAYEATWPLPEDAGSDAVAEPLYASKSFGTDFLFGFFHFVLFTALAMSLQNHTIHFGRHDLFREILFMGLLALILLYDLLWLVLNWTNDTFHLIKIWAFINFLTVAASAAFYGGAWLVYLLFGWEFNIHTGEAYALVPVLFASAVDIIEIIMRKRIISGFLIGTAKRMQKLASDVRNRDIPADENKKDRIKIRTQL